MTITVDVERCIGAGNCVDTAPGYFDQNEDDGTVTLLRSSIGRADLELIDEAVLACPVRAILATDHS